MPNAKRYIVEHLDPELGAWSALEYQTIAEECTASGSSFTLSSVPHDLKLPTELASAAGLTVEHQGVEEAYADQKERICLLDPAAQRELSPSDAQEFDIFLFGGILGDDPPRDRTSELRKKGFHGRRLGPVQMTTDTAVRVTRLVIEGGQSLDSLPYVDHPELQVNKHESTQMPFRYVRDPSGQPVMPKGMLELIKQDADKSIEDLF